MFGLIISDPARDTARRKELEALLYALDLPAHSFTEANAPLFQPGMARAAFLRQASAALLWPGQAIPMDLLLQHLNGTNPLPGNVIRRYLFLQLSLLPYLRPGRTVTPLEGCFLVGEDVLVAPVALEDTVDALLPPGVWTELNGAIQRERLRGMRGYNEMPVLVRGNALLPIGVNDRSVCHDDADRLTLHWFQPQQQAECILADGTRYQVQRDGETITVQADTQKPFHLIVHQDGAEVLVR